MPSSNNVRVLVDVIDFALAPTLERETAQRMDQARELTKSAKQKGGEDRVNTLIFNAMKEAHAA